MKWNKRFFAIAAAAMMAVSAAGCSSNTTGGGDADVEALIAKAQETMESVNSMKSVMSMDMSMAAGEESLDITTEATILAMGDPLKMQMDIAVKMGETEQAMQMFAAEAEDAYMSYMNMEGAWYAVPMEMDDLEQYNAEENMDLYLENITSFSAAGEEDINGTKATKITGVITGDAMKEAIEASGAMGSVESLGISAEEVESMYADLGDLPLSLWIDADGYVRKYEIDMTAIMQSVVSKALAAEAGEDAGVQLTKMMVTMVCSDFNAVQDIEIPAEALEAPILQQ